MNTLKPIPLRGGAVALVGDLHSELTILRQHDPACPFRLYQVLDGRGALGLATDRLIDTWMVSWQLVDMSGLECIEMLQELVPRARFCLISETYNLHDERRAFQCYRTTYTARPVTGQWLDQYLQWAIRSPSCDLADVTSATAESFRRPASPRSPP